MMPPEDVLNWSFLAIGLTGLFSFSRAHGSDESTRRVVFVGRSLVLVARARRLTMVGLPLLSRVIVVLAAVLDEARTGW